MPDSDAFPRARPGGAGAAVPLLFAGVLSAWVYGGGWTAPGGAAQPAPALPAPVSAPVLPAGAPVDGDGARSRAALAARRSGAVPARALVSRGGARWDARYDAAGFAAYSRSLDGTYTGVGLSLAHDADGALRVTRVSHGGPAARAGLTPGTRLVRVAGHRVAGLPVTEVVALLRGGPGAAPGSAVTLRTGAGGGAEARTVRLRRAALVTRQVTVRPLAPGTVRIRVAAFTKGTGARLRETVAALPPGTGVVLDLRGNPGGLLTEAADAAGAFLDGGLVATYEDHGTQRSLYAHPAAPGAARTGGPLVALVDGGTMSAAEVLTGALQDRGRAVVVGGRTFGKGTVQRPSRLPDGGVAELTVGHWSTPSGRGADGTGLAPDVAVRGDAAAAERRARTVLGGLGHPS